VWAFGIYHAAIAIEFFSARQPFPAVVVFARRFVDRLL
jgi:hypothetical protein